MVSHRAPPAPCESLDLGSARSISLEDRPRPQCTDRTIVATIRRVLSTDRSITRPIEGQGEPLDRSAGPPRGARHGRAYDGNSASSGSRPRSSAMWSGHRSVARTQPYRVSVFSSVVRIIPMSCSPDYRPRHIQLQAMVSPLASCFSVAARLVTRSSSTGTVTVVVGGVFIHPGAPTEQGRHQH